MARRSLKLDWPHLRRQKTKEAHDDKEAKYCDDRLSAEDGSFDANDDAKVSFEEFVAQIDLPYPAWNGDVTRNVVYKRAGNEMLHVKGAGHGWYNNPIEPSREALYRRTLEFVLKHAEKVVQ